MNKKLLLIGLLSCLMINSIAILAFNKKNISGKPKKPLSQILYLGGGFNTLNSAAKSTILLKNSTSLDFNYSLGGGYSPFSKPWRTIFLNPFINFGFNYQITNSNTPKYFPTNSFNVIGAINNQLVSNVTFNKKVNGMRFLIGPQWFFPLKDKFSISPILYFGYITQSSYDWSVTQSYENNGIPYKYTLYNKKINKVNSFGFLPKLRFNYLRKNIGYWIETGYQTGLSVKTQTTEFIPSGSPNTNNQYIQGQMEDGNTDVKETKTKITGFEIKTGIFIPINIPYQPNKPYNPNLISKPISNLAPTKSDENYQNKNCIEYSAPQIISPVNNSTINITNGELILKYIATNAPVANYIVTVRKESKGKMNIIWEKIVSNNWNGVIENLKTEKEGYTQLEISMQAVSCKIGNCVPVNKDAAAFKNAGCSTFENNGKSNTIILQSTSNNGCYPSYEMKITKAECADSGKIKVYGYYAIQVPTGQGVSYINLTGMSAEITGQGTPINTTNESASISNLPLNVTNQVTTGSAPQNKVQFTFYIDGEDYCKKSLSVYLNFTSSLVTYNGSYTPTNCVRDYQCYWAKDSLPCCICKLCDDTARFFANEIQNNAQFSNGNLLINQSFNAGPLNFSKTGAEVIYMEEYPIEEACRTCRDTIGGKGGEKAVYHFMGSNTMAWNGAAAANASADNGLGSMPSKSISWSTNNKGNLVYNLTFALPGTANMSCCEKHGKICIRYSFTNVDCKTCYKIVCYEY